jgi:hypothetical protein
MKALHAYIKKQNDWDSFFNRTNARPLGVDTPEDRQRLARRIDNELSPENLTCDGELSRAEINRRYNNLIRVAEQLRKLDPTVQFWEV